MKKKILLALFAIFTLLVALAAIYFVLNRPVLLEDKKEKTTIQTEVKKAAQKTENQQKEKNADEILKIIDDYQARYFAVFERDIKDELQGNYFSDEYEKKGLDTFRILFNELEEKVDKNNKYYKKIQKIEKDYSSNPGETTADMADYERKEYEAYDEVLNEIYQEVKKKLKSEDFQKLKISQLKWIKEEIKYSNMYYDSEHFGTMGILQAISSHINARHFRILLLTFYL